MYPFRFSHSLLAALLLLLPLCLVSSAQTARERIVKQIDENDLQPLVRNTHPLARREFDRGAAPGDLALNRMLLVLTRSVERQAGLRRSFAGSTG